MKDPAVIVKHQVSATALRLAEAAVGHARKNGWEVAATAVDASGCLAAFVRTDGVVAPTVTFAIDKAYTAASLRKSTKAFFERAESNPSLKLGLANRDRLMVWSGGVPLFHGGRCIGGLGVSGAQDHEDVECAEAAVRACRLDFS